jgi:hypothetical protein
LLRVTSSKLVGDLEKRLEPAKSMIWKRSSGLLKENSKGFVMKKALLAFVLAITTTTAQAQQGIQCNSREAMVQLISGTYGEVRKALGLSSRNFAMGLYVNDQTGSWTLAYTQPTGVMCIVAHDTNYEEIDEPIGDTY